MWWRDGWVGITSDVSLFDHFQVRPGAAAAVLRSRGELLLQCDQQHAVPHSTAVLPAGPCHAETAVQQRISCSEVCQSMCKIKSSDIKVQNDAHCHVHPLFCCCLHALMFKNTLFLILFMAAFTSIQPLSERSVSVPVSFSKHSFSLLKLSSEWEEKLDIYVSHCRGIYQC